MYKGIEIDQCPTCEGIWLDKGELDQLEDTVLDDDAIKGTLDFSDISSDLVCDVCHEKLLRFDYRYYGLFLDYCKNGHGWWLDKDEHHKIETLMGQREKDMERKYTAEEDWKKFIGRLQSPTFFDKVKDLFGKKD